MVGKRNFRRDRVSLGMVSEGEGELSFWKRKNFQDELVRLVLSGTRVYTLQVEFVIMCIFFFNNRIY